MTKQLFDHTLVDNDQDAMDFLENILESSTEYSIIGKEPSPFHCPMKAIAGIMP